MKTTAGLLLFLLFAIRGEAQEKVVDKKFVLVGATMHLSMIVDGKTTFDLLKRCPECYEKNPLVAPFIKRGPVVAYMAGTVAEVGVMYVAYKMKGSDNAFLRKTWWLAPIVITALHTKGALMNYRFQVGGEVSSIKLN